MRRNTRKKSKAGKRLKYNMYGCSKKNHKHHKNHKHPKIYLGGQNMNTPYPNTGPPPNPYTILASKSQSGGSCGCGAGAGLGNFFGGGCGCGKLFGGSNSQKGGSSTTFIGSPWTPTNWPSANNANHYSMNTYTPLDIQLQTKVLGANPPFSGLKGGRNRRTRKTLQKGGNLSNSLFQDLANFGRGLSYAGGSAYNTVMGVPAPVNPLPWKGQFQSL